mgnify:CR=1 FL=1
MSEKVFEDALNTLDRIENSQVASIRAAADLIAKSMEKGGILQGFGSGYYLSGARELCHRVGGLMPTKIIYEPSYGRFESLVGVGKQMMEIVDLRPEDVVVLSSHSSIVPTVVEVAIAAKERGASLIVITSLEGAQKQQAIHPSGKKAYEMADVVIDTCFPYSEAMFDPEGKDTEVIGMSYYATIVILQTITMLVMERLSELKLSHLIIGATGSKLDPKSVPFVRDTYKKYKTRTQRF